VEENETNITTSESWKTEYIETHCTMETSDGVWKRRIWVRPTFTQLRRHFQGDSDNLVIEMELQDQEMFYNYCRMSREMFY